MKKNTIKLFGISMAVLLLVTGCGKGWGWGSGWNTGTSMFHNLYFVWGWVLTTVDGWTATLLTIGTDAWTVLAKGTCETWAVP